MKKNCYFTCEWLPAIFILLSIIFNSCANKKEPNPQKLVLQIRNSYQLNIPEPSGLTLSPDGKSLFTVSDETGKVYVISTGGELIRNFSVNGEDLEGITFTGDSAIAIVLERSREILICRADGMEIKKINTGLKGDLNSGLEGIVYDPTENIFYLVNEKKPSLLIKADNKFKILHRKEIKFASDLSGLSLTGENLWILSDESSLIAKCDKDGEIIEAYKIPVQQPEGIAVDEKNNLIYIVSDFTGILYVFEIIEH